MDASRWATNHLRYSEDMPEISQWRWGATGRELGQSRKDTAADF